MSVKVTSKGTELPLLNLKGKPYLQVAHRLVWYREDHPLGRIVNTPVTVTDAYAIFKSEVWVLGTNPDGSARELLMATAHKKETEGNFGDFIEKAETGAMGRALGMAGYGTQFAPEFDEGDRLADSPIQPAVKPKRGGANVSSVEPKPPTPVQAAVPKATSREIINQKIKKTSEIIQQIKKTPRAEIEAMLTPFSVDSVTSLTDVQAAEFLNQLTEKLNK